MNANDLPGNEDRPHHNGNGNGNGWTKPGTHPDTLAILEARNKALAEPRSILTLGAKACFCEILDRALDPEFFDRKKGRGIVTLSDQYLAGKFRVTKRAIYDWKKALEIADYVWTSKQWRANFWPMTTYHICALHKKPTAGKTDSGGTYGGGKLRPAPFKGIGARDPGQLMLRLEKRRRKKDKTTPATPPQELPAAAAAAEMPQLQGTSAENGNLLRLTAERRFGSEPNGASADSRTALRLTAERRFGSEPNGASADSRTALRRTAEPDCPVSETQIGGVAVELKEIRGGGEGKPTTTPREEKFLRKYPMPIFDPLDREMFHGKRGAFADEGIAMAKDTRIGIANDPLSKHPGAEEFHPAAAAVRKAYGDRIAELKKWRTGQR